MTDGDGPGRGGGGGGGIGINSTVENKRDLINQYVFIWSFTLKK